mgnify:CR=1 FL=1
MTVANVRCQLFGLVTTKRGVDLKDAVDVERAVRRLVPPQRVADGVVVQAAACFSSFRARRHRRSRRVAPPASCSTGVCAGGVGRGAATDSRELLPQSVLRPLLYWRPPMWEAAVLAAPVPQSRAVPRQSSAEARLEGQPDAGPRLEPRSSAAEVTSWAVELLQLGRRSMRNSGGSARPAPACV